MGDCVQLGRVQGKRAVHTAELVKSYALGLHMIMHTDRLVTSRVISTQRPRHDQHRLHPRFDSRPEH